MTITISVLGDEPINTRTKEIIGIAIVALVIAANVVIYINYVESQEHIVPVYIGVDKKEYGPNDTVTNICASWNYMVVSL